MRFWKLYLAVFILMAIFFKSKAIYMAFYAMLILHFGTKALHRYAFLNLEISRKAKKTHLFSGETVDIEMTIKNPTWMPIAWISGYDHLPIALEAGKPKRWVASLPLRTTSSISYSLTGRHRGLYVAGPIDVTVGDSLGLFSVTGPVEDFQEIVVYPNVHPLHKLGLPSRLPFGNLKALRKIYPDPSRLAGVRPYQSGDTMQSIHWKATARTGEFQVKLYEHTVTLDSIILLNLDERDYSVHRFSVDSEVAIETASSLANYLSRAGEPYGFITNARLERQAKNTPQDDKSAEDIKIDDKILRIMPHKGTAQLMRVLESLAAAVCKPAPNFEELVSKESRHFAWGATILIVTPVDSDRLIELALSLTKSGYQVLIFVVGKDILHKQLLNRPAHANLQIYRVNRDAALFISTQAQ